ncbi:MAG: PAS domain-containing sensor histidine kinase [Gelidibacter sp.]|uniref:sensor histidine kinase n=1 Tax=Gelidibacter sp. TaxID=2018083 RepID=UPI003267D3E6
MTSPESGLQKLNLNSTFVDNLKWQLALEYSDIGMWEYDAVSDRLFFSEGSRKIIGVSETFVGADTNYWNERVHPDDRMKYHQDFQDHLNGLKSMYENEHRILCENGTYKWIRDRGKIVEWGPNNEPKRIIGTHTDITTQKQDQDTINASLAIVTEHNNKLKNFAHIVTHNLKQHTANFESLLELYDETETPDEKEEIMAHLRMLSHSLTKTIVNLHDVVREQNTKTNLIKKIFITEEINNILEVLKFVITENKATVHNKINEKLFLYYNYSYFESIIQNLLSNAIKYKHPDRDPVITIDCAYDKQEFKLIISDNGIGIDLDKYGNDIFGLYKTFHHNRDAEGIGLYLIKNQIESFGGQITVESTINEGTTFTIYVKNKKV